MATRTLTALLVLTASCALAQQYNGNYVDGGDFDYQDQQSLPPARPAPAPIQRSIRPNPPQQSLRPTGPTTPRAPPVAILKQINKHNDDGSYTYGFEGADGSFKIETKLATGEVMGKYGYVDDTGKVRTVEYGANKFGFQPVGEGITVAPPTLVDESRRPKGDQAPDYDDGQYYEELPAPPPRAKAQLQPQRARPAPRPKAPQHSFQPQPQHQGEVIYQEQPQYSQPPPAPRVSHGFGPEPPRAQIPGAAPVPHNEPAYRPQPPPHRAYPGPQSTQARFIPPPPQQRSFSQPPPQRHFPAQPAPVHQFEHHSSPQPQQHFQQPARPLPQARPSGGSYFDQLTKDYALPTGGHSVPIHDVAFGVQY